ncbi:MAG: acetate--CoA ligase family protein [Rhizobiales bacterium]|nr:acetate--CoA ligase family protein [Hyphomicrobiales bacterium]
MIDLTLAGTRADIMKGALSGEYDLIVAVVGSSARNHPELAVAPIIEMAEDGTPLAAFIVPDAPAALEMLTRNDVPGFRTPESCADAIRAAFARETPRAREIRIHSIEGFAIDEREAYALCDRLDIARAPTVVLAPDKRLPSIPFSYPVVAKVLSRDIAHKSDIGGVVLNIADAQALQTAAEQIRRRVAATRMTSNADHVLVQPMEKGVGEALIGYRIDPQVGPVVIVAAGGTTTEIYKDRALRLAPVTLDVARAMIAEVKGFETMRGFRGHEKGDLDALAQAIVQFSMIGEVEPRITEAEVNPVIVRRQGAGVVAVDALMRLAAHS